MEISPDQWVIIEWQGWQLNATLVFTWVVMALLCGASWLITRRLCEDESVSRWQIMLEVIVGTIRKQISDIGPDEPDRYLPFIGTLFLFIAMANLLTIIPGYEPPTGSLSTTVALALCVLVAVPVYAITGRGVGGYLKSYVKPSIVMLPFNIVSELSRTIALAVRLYGNMMSGTIIAGILISVAPLFFPIVMQVLGLLTGMIQAYIFAILAMVYITSAARAERKTQDGEPALATTQTTDATEKELSRPSSSGD